MAQATKTPSWLTVTAEAVTVRLSKPTQANGIEVDKLQMRPPTVRDIRAAQSGGDDEEQRELNLFATLTEIGVKDLEGMTVKDYSRLQKGYFRLVQDDEL